MHAYVWIKDKNWNKCTQQKRCLQSFVWNLEGLYPQTITVVASTNIDQEDAVFRDTISSVLRIGVQSQTSHIPALYFLDMWLQANYFTSLCLNILTLYWFWTILHRLFHEN